MGIWQGRREIGAGLPAGGIALGAVLLAMAGGFAVSFGTSHTDMAETQAEMPVLAQAQPGVVLQRSPGRPPPPPRGFRYAFGDGRLNPDRGRGTTLGDQQMGEFWTDTVPRQLVPGAELRASPVEQRIFKGQ